MSYKQINESERDRIGVLKAKGLSAREIGRQLGRHHSTIVREISRNCSKGQYLPHKAQDKAKKRERISRTRRRLKNHAIRYDVEQMLIKNWSPERISGRLKLLNGKTIISHEAIYQWIYSDAVHLIYYLPRKHKKRYPRGFNRFANRKRIPDRVSISQRSVDINKRIKAGHWETDLLESTKKTQTSLQVCVERKTRFTQISRVKDKTAYNSANRLCKILGRYPKRLRKSITYDNGRENTNHMSVNKLLGTKSYFCNPYHSWEKGTVENTNELIRRFLPKKTNFDNITQEEIKRVEDWLNNRPMKVLGYRTPKEVFDSFVALAP